MIVVYSASSQHTANLSFVIFLSFFFFFSACHQTALAKYWSPPLLAAKSMRLSKLLGLGFLLSMNSLVWFCIFILFCSASWLVQGSDGGWGNLELPGYVQCIMFCPRYAPVLFLIIYRAQGKKKKKKSTEPSGTFGVVEFTTVCWDDRRSGSRFDEIN